MRNTDMEHNSFSSGLLIGIVCTAIIAGLAIFTLTRKKQVRVKEEKRRGEGKNSPDPQPQKTKQPLPLNAKLFAPYIKKFGSSIGALWQVTNVGNDGDIGTHIFNNLDLIINSIDSPELKKEWEAFVNDRSSWDDGLYKDKASGLLDVFISNGVEISNERHIVWDDKSHLRYRKFFKVENGDKCEVLSPYALYEGLVIDQGLVKKI